MWPFGKRGNADDPSDEGAWRGRLQALLRTGRWDEAEARLRARLAANPRDTWARNKLAAALAFAGRRAEAVSVLDALIADEPDYAPAWVNRGNMAFEADDLDEAERYYRKALELDPASAAAHNNLAALFKRRGDIASMVAHLKRSRAAERQRFRRDPSVGTRRDES